jgi:hypothetical protein
VVWSVVNLKSCGKLGRFCGKLGRFCGKLEFKFTTEKNYKKSSTNLLLVELKILNIIDTIFDL